MKSTITSKRVVSGLLLLSYCCSPLALGAQPTQAQEQPTRGFYSQLLPFFINTQQASLSAQQQPSITTGTQTAKKTQAIDVTLHQLSDNEQARMALEILDHYAPTEPIAAAQVAPLEKFNIKLAGKRDVVTRLMPRGTVWGQIAFAADCTKAFDYDELTQRQTITKSFVEQDRLRKQAQKAFELIKSGQRAYLSYFEQLDETTKKVLESVYFSNPALTWLNTNKPALAVAEAGRWLQLSFWPATCSGLGISLMIASGKAFKAGSWNEWLRVPDKTITDFAKKFFYSHYPIANCQPTEADKELEAKLATEFLQDVPGMFKKSLPGLPEIMYQDAAQRTSNADREKLAAGLARMERISKNQITPSVQENYAQLRENKYRPASAFAYTYGWTIITDTLLAFSLKKAAAEIAQTNSVYNNYQTRLIGMAKIVRGLTMLADVARESGNEHMQAVAQDIELFLDASTRPDLAALLDALETGTFATDTGFLSNRPRILAAHKLMEQCREYFVRPLAAAGRLETFVDSADYYAKHEGTGKPVSFVEFVNDEQPRLELENCWNILIDEDRAVVIEAIKFGKYGAQNAILNGPNGTGKSTNENAIALAYFLAKFGINCGSHAVMTPFEGFEVHRNEQEDVEKGDSSFMAQKARFDAICSAIAGLNGKRMVIFMDEPLNGTVEQEAGRIIYEKCSELLAHQKQAICIIATHAEQPTRLEADTHGAFANYYVEVVEPELGQFMRTYRLLPGLATWWFNDVDKRHRFVEWLSHEINIVHATDRSELADE